MTARNRVVREPYATWCGRTPVEIIHGLLPDRHKEIDRFPSSSTAPKSEILGQRENDIIPIEVKSEANTASRSMKKFKELFPNQVKLRVRFSLNNLKLDDDVLNIPLFLADQADRLIGLALRIRGQAGIESK